MYLYIHELIYYVWLFYNTSLTSRCPNMAILDAEMSDNEDESDTKLETKKAKPKALSQNILHKVTWGKNLKLSLKETNVMLLL